MGRVCGLTPEYFCSTFLLNRHLLIMGIQNDIIFFTSNAGFKIYFEKKNASIEDIERLRAFFDKQNITWRKSIL